jgi:hypothetical protein
MLTRTNPDLTRTPYPDSRGCPGKEINPDAHALPPLGGSVMSGLTPRGQRGQPAGSRPHHTGGSGLGRIDFAAVAADVDLPALLAAEGIEVRHGKARCPFHDDRRPSLSVYYRGGRWRFRCPVCRVGGDALDWLRERQGLDAAAAARWLDPAVEGRRSRSAHPAPAPRPEPAPAWHDPAWQWAVEALVVEAEACLWGARGRAALDWLRSRGLADATIARFRLGFIPADGWATFGAGLARRRIFRPRGITIPWPCPGAWYVGDVAGRRWAGCNVRRMASDVFGELPGDVEKYRAVAGSERGHLYPWPEILPTQGALAGLIIEGELDAIMGEQEAGWLVRVGTVGAASTHPHRSALAALARCPWWLIATDHDAAGIDAARAWRERAPHKSRRVLLPHGKDLTEFVQAGGDVRAWLADEVRRLGLPGPVRSGV